MPSRNAVNWRSGEADVSRVRQSAHQVVAEVAAGCAVGFVHQHHHAVTGIDVRGDVVELVDHRNDQPAIIRGEGFLQVLLALDYLGRKAITNDVLVELPFKFVSVNYISTVGFSAPGVSQAASQPQIALSEFCRFPAYAR